MIRTLKLFKYQFEDRYGRLLLVHWLIRELPGPFGQRIRMKLLGRRFQACGRNLLIHQGFRFRGIHRIRAGDNVQIGVDNFLQASGGLELGDDVMLGPGVKIWTINHRFDSPDRPIYDQGYDYRPVKIGKGVWLGANVFVLPGVTIPEGCVVTAGSLVGVKRYPPWSILSGNPCRVIGNRRPGHAGDAENHGHRRASGAPGADSARPVDAGRGGRSIVAGEKKQDQD